MNDLDRVSDILTSLVEIYKELLSLLKREREYLIAVDTENLLKIIELKQYMSLNLKTLEDELKSVFCKHNVDNIHGFLFLLSKERDVDDVRVKSGMLMELMDKFNKEALINRMITQESVSFYNSMINMYMGFMHNRKESYDKDATIGITQKIVSLKV